MSYKSLCHVAAITCLLSPSALFAQDQVVEVVFTPNMGKAELVGIQEDVRAKGLELVYTTIDMTDGVLHAIGFKVSAKNGSGTGEGEVTADNKFGFRYDPTGATASFRIGSLDGPPVKDK